PEAQDIMQSRSDRTDGMFIHGYLSPNIGAMRQGALISEEVFTLDSGMSELETIISGLSGKVRKLGERQRMLMSENELLKKRLGELEAEAIAQKNAYRELGEQHKITKIAGSVGHGPEDRKAERKKLNDLVREIDRCIAL